MGQQVEHTWQAQLISRPSTPPQQLPPCRSNKPSYESLANRPPTCRLLATEARSS